TVAFLFCAKALAALFALPQMVVAAEYYQAIQAEITSRVTETAESIRVSADQLRLDTDGQELERDEADSAPTTSQTGEVDEMAIE
ncbi:hypothetical protein KIPB_016576, partial [Kipferlia bialata]